MCISKKPVLDPHRSRMAHPNPSINRTPKKLRFLDSLRATALAAVMSNVEAGEKALKG